jgi:hypothetical protein
MKLVLKGVEHSFGLELRRVHQQEPTTVAAAAWLQKEMRMASFVFKSLAYTSAAT